MLPIGSIQRTRKRAEKQIYDFQDKHSVEELEDKGKKCPESRSSQQNRRRRSGNLEQGRLYR